MRVCCGRCSAIIWLKNFSWNLFLLLRWSWSLTSIWSFVGQACSCSSVDLDRSHLSDRSLDKLVLAPPLILVAHIYLFVRWTSLFLLLRWSWSLTSIWSFVGQACSCSSVDLDRSHSIWSFVGQACSCSSVDLDRSHLSVRSLDVSQMWLVSSRLLQVWISWVDFDHVRFNAIIISFINLSLQSSSWFISPDSF